MTGTLWHSHFERMFRSRGVPVMMEVQMDCWLPEGWAGRPDWIVWDAEYEAFVLMDLKTTRPEAIPYIKNEGIKEEHLWQLSAYWYALEKMGLPLVDKFTVFYLPKYYSQDAEPLQLEGRPINATQIGFQMEDRWLATRKYLNEVDAGWLNEYLAPEQDRIQKLRPNPKMSVMDLKLEPHWSARFCPFLNELCACSEQKAEKIGHYYYDLSKGQVFYLPRKGYQAVQPLVKPTRTQEATLREWDKRDAEAKHEQHQRSTAEGSGGHARATEEQS